MSEHLTIEELASRWDLSRSTLAIWRMRKKGPAYMKIGRKVYYALADVVAFEAAQKTGA